MGSTQQLVGTDPTSLCDGKGKMGTRESRWMPWEAVGTDSQLQDRLAQLHPNPALRTVTVLSPCRATLHT